MVDQYRYKPYVFCLCRNIRTIRRVVNRWTDEEDYPDARLVVLGVDAPYSGDAGNAAEAAAKAMLEFRGSAPGLYRNTLVFLAADKTRSQKLDEATRRFRASQSIVKESGELDLTAH
jgi:hypothetical protein